jgi:hypothetical protein
MLIQYPNWIRYQGIVAMPCIMVATHNLDAFAEHRFCMNIATETGSPGMDT